MIFKRSMPPPSRCAAAMLLMVCASANADLYTYIDESGVT